MQWTDYLRFVMALVFVMGLMGGLYLILRKFNLGAMPAMGAKRRLKVVESLMIDSRHRAVILSHDDKEHLVILSPSGETVVQTSIETRIETPVHDQIQS